MTSSSPIGIVPAVGSISRVRQRTRVDLPEPERPITTKTSPGATSKETSLTPTTQPVFFFRSARERSASGVPMILSAPSPKIFQTFSTVSPAPRVLASPAWSIGVLVVAVMACPRPMGGCSKEWCSGDVAAVSGWVER